MNMQRNAFVGNVFIFAILIIFIFNVDASAQDKPITPEISGFGDVYLNIGENQSDDFEFQIGQFELDVAARIKPHIQVEAAVAYDGEESFEIGAFIIDFHLFGDGDWHYHRSDRVRHSGVMVGRFDVPFGIDWRVYPSIDRQLISVPQAVELTHNGWNDIGAHGYLVTENFNVAMYVVNGFEYEADQVLTSSSAFGGRFGVVPSEQLEIGGSLALLSVEDSDIDMLLLGADAGFGAGDFTGKAELIAHTIEALGGDDITNIGFYAQGKYDFGRLYGIARIGVFSYDESDDDDNYRLSFGGGLPLADDCWLRFEYQANSEDSDVGLMQVAVGF